VVAGFAAILSCLQLCILHNSVEWPKAVTAMYKDSIFSEDTVISPLYSSRVLKDNSMPEENMSSPLEVMEKEQISRIPGVQFLQHIKEVKESKSTNFLFDVLSIGSISHTELLQAQSDTWASHSSIGNFFGATEQDDPDPNCYKTLTNEEVIERSKFCRRETDENTASLNALTKVLSSAYACHHFLGRKANPAGWMCAQRRPPFALAKLLRLYRKGYNIHGDSFLPPYLIVTDDDTFVDIPLLEKKLMVGPNVGDSALIPSHMTPVVFAGCRVRHLINEVNFTFSYGGFGQFFSRGALKRFIQPLYCDNTSSTGFEQEACERITDSKAVTIGENKYFEPGMSISDLMEVYTKSDDFCLHSDWVTAYFVNFYNISRHVVDDGVWFNAESRMDNVKEARFHTLDQSEVSISNVDAKSGHCGVEHLEACTRESMICHRLSPEDMRLRHIATLY